MSAVALTSRWGQLVDSRTLFLRPCLPGKQVEGLRKALEEEQGKTRQNVQHIENKVREAETGRSAHPGGRPP